MDSYQKGGVGSMGEKGKGNIVFNIVIIIWYNKFIQ